MTEKLERLEAKRFARTKAPRKSVEETDTSAPSHATSRLRSNERSRNVIRISALLWQKTVGGVTNGRGSSSTTTNPTAVVVIIVLTIFPCYVELTTGISPSATTVRN